jgi:hypothetical protein
LSRAPRQAVRAGCPARHAGKPVGASAHRTRPLRTWAGILAAIFGLRRTGVHRQHLGIGIASERKLGLHALQFDNQDGRPANDRLLGRRGVRLVGEVLSVIAPRSAAARRPAPSPMADCCQGSTSGALGADGLRNVLLC